MKTSKYSFIILMIFFINIMSACLDPSGLSDSPGGGGTTDTTAPEWNAGYPSAIVLDDRVYLKISLNENGHVYCVLLCDGDPAPDVDRIIGGFGEFAADMVAVSGTLETMNFTGLGYSSMFDLYCVAKDESDNTQPSAVKLDISIGARDTVFVSQKDGDDTNMGTITYPKKTIASALAYAKANWPVAMSRKVCLSRGTYDESVELTEGISLSGGYNPSDWSERNSALYQSKITGVSGQSYVLSITGTNISTGNWFIEGLLIYSDKSSVSQGLRCNADSLVIIRNNEIHGGFAANEATAVYIYGNSDTEISTNSIVGGISETGDTCGILIESSGNHLIKENSVYGGNGFANFSYAVKIIKAVDTDTMFINNNINGGIAYDTFGIYISHDSDSVTSSPLIWGNIIYSGSGVDVSAAIAAIGGTLRPVSPVICNNLIETGSGNDSFGVVVCSGHAFVYNNIIYSDSMKFCGVFTNGDGAESVITLINNIIYNYSCAIIEIYGGAFDNIMNNDIFNCTYLYDSETWGRVNSITGLNGLHTGISGNVSIDASLDSLHDFTYSTPLSVTEGGFDLSGFSLFPVNSSGEKIDIEGSLRTEPWSMGAYENE